MENKKYIDKVIGSLVRGTYIDYDKKLVTLVFLPPHKDYFSSPQRFHFSRFNYEHIFYLFSNYCENTFGLTEDEIKYVWNEYKSIITDKIKNGQ